jgi:outer membrane protein TolC
MRAGLNLRNARAAALLALGLTAGTALLEAQVSLSTVVDLAQKNASAVRMAQADVQKAQAVYNQTVDVYYPSLTVGSTVGYSFGFPTGQPSIANANMQSLVLSYPQRQYIRAARAGWNAATLALKDAQEQKALEASTAYIELDTVTHELDAAHEQETDTSRLVEIERQRTEAGVDPLSELLQARLKAAQLKLNRLHLETRAGTLAKQLSALTGLPAESIATDHGSIPEIPAVKADEAAVAPAGIQSAAQLAQSKQLQAHGDDLAGRPQIGFGAIYNLDSDALNNYSTYYNHYTPNNLSFGISITIPLFDFGVRSKAKQSAAEALRATVEAEEARRQNDVRIATITGNLRELDALADIASLKQQIANEQLQAVLAQMELGNGAASGSNAQPQLTPKAEQLARIDERQKVEDALDAGFDLSKARLNLLCALGHMQDWLNELHAK